MENNKIQAVVFDMDGVIFDTEKLVLKCWQEVAKRHGIENIEKACMSCLGLNQYASHDRFCEIYGEDFPYWDLKKETRELFYGPYYGEHLPFKEGVVELLQELKAKGIPVALATSTRKEAVLMELEDAGIIQYFDEIVCGDMVERSKPFPDIFLKACEMIKINPQDAIAIEDSFNGIRAAHAAGMKPIMIPDMVEPDDEIKALLAGYFKSLVEFRKKYFISPF